jgi:Fic family protein
LIQNYIRITEQTPENGIWLAAWFHHRFVNIHPFRVCLFPYRYYDVAANASNQDGNGRVTRALVSAILARFGLLPLLVTVEDKEEYFHALMTVSWTRYIYDSH